MTLWQLLWVGIPDYPPCQGYVPLPDLPVELTVMLGCGGDLKNHLLYDQGKGAYLQHLGILTTTGTIGSFIPFPV